jgi:hypothetical protein
VIPFLLFVLLAALAVAFVVTHDRGAPMEAVGLQFGSEIEAQAVEAVLNVISALPRGGSVVFETYASQSGIRHGLRGEQATLDLVCGQLRALIPSTRLDPGFTQPPTAWRRAVELRWGTREPLLHTNDPKASATSLLAAMSPLADGEAVLLQALLRPGHRPLPILPRNDQAENVHLPALRAKRSGPLVDARVRVAVAAATRGRALHMLGRVNAAVRARRGALGQLTVRNLSASEIGRGDWRAWWGGDLLSPTELTGLIGWPLGAPQLPGLVLGAAPLLLPDRRIPTDGIPVGIATWPGMEQRRLSQPLVGALSHTLIAGPTGSGKSSLLTSVLRDHAEAGRGLLLIDGKGDLADDVLAHIPADRLSDVIVLDPASQLPVPGLRVFGRGRDPELTADLVLGVLRDLFQDTWGVRSEQWLRTGLTTLCHDSQATFGDLGYVFSDDAYRRSIVGRLRDPLLLAAWSSFEAMKPAERANQLGAPLNKINQLLGRRVLRTILSQEKPSLDLTDAIRRNRIVIVSLQPGRIGGPAARLLGALLVHQLLVAVQARAAMAPARRRPFFAYIDEPRVLGDLPVPLDTLFELSRGLGVGLGLSVQSVRALPAPVREAALTNVATIVAFRQNHDDAELLAAQLSGVTAEALEHLGPFEIVTRIGLGPGDVAAPASGRTLPPPPATIAGDVVRRASAERYGSDPALVDEALAARHRPAAAIEPDDFEIGRRRRTT